MYDWIVVHSVLYFIIFNINDFHYCATWFFNTVIRANLRIIKNDLKAYLMTLEKEELERSL